MTYLTTGKVAKCLGCSREHVRLLAKRGEITYFQRPGGSIRISENALNEYLEQHTCHARRFPQGSPEFQDGKTGTSETVANQFRLARRIARRLSDA